MQAVVRKPAKSEKTPRRKKRSEQVNGAMDLLASPQNARNRRCSLLHLSDLEVTGISPSGRVRNKSLKLMDFESTDDLAAKHKRQRVHQQRLQAQQLLDRFETPPPPSVPHTIAQGQNSHTPGHGARNKKICESQTAIHKVKLEPVPCISDTKGQSVESDLDYVSGLKDEDCFSMDSGSDYEVDPLLINEKEMGFRRLEPREQETPSKAKSIYTLEKCKKKLIIKDGKTIGRMKAQRKDKGKTRFTSYMLWAKEIRPELLEQCPNMDFAAISKRLAELWSTVPNLEKNNWRRRAKRLAAKPHVPTTSKDEPMWKIKRRKKHPEQLNGAMNLLASSKRQKIDEVTGISRSGRVRKKSSKLMDFESPVDLADKHKRQRVRQQQLQSQQLLDRSDTPLTPSVPHTIAQGQNSHTPDHGTRNRKISESQTAIHKVKLEPDLCISDTEGQSLESDLDYVPGLNDEDRFSMDSGNDAEVDPLLIDEKETGFRRLEPREQETPSQANSIYMLEKCKKKLIIKDGKTIGRMKAQRKDKGKTRFTSYMLWAKEIRQELLEQCPNMDFAAISKRLGELWSTVSNLEKYNWRRRAKRLAAKPHVPRRLRDVPTSKMKRHKKHPERLNGAMNLFASPKRQKIDDLEVTGISRSGRVRKKSSKLIDFESAGNLADKHKRQRAHQQQLQAQQLLDRFDTHPPPSISHTIAQGLNSHTPGHGARNRKISESQIAIHKVKLEPAPYISDTEGQFVESDLDYVPGLKDEDRFSMDSGNDDEVDPLLIEEKETGFRRLEPREQETSSQANSLYMLEKCKKNLIIQDGKTIGRMKARHKVKGKTRLTAYMLWAKEIRQELLEQCPNMDFAAISKRLAELWSTVPNLERDHWRRRAKRLTK